MLEGGEEVLGDADGPFLVDGDGDGVLFGAPYVGEGLVFVG